MAGSWLNLVRSPYDRLFKKSDTSTCENIIKPPTPPPVSPIVCTPSKHVIEDDSDSEDLNGVDVDISDLIEVNMPRTIIPVPHRPEPAVRLPSSATEKMKWFKNIRTEELKFILATQVKFSTMDFDFLSTSGLPTLFDFLRKTPSPVIFDVTQSVLLSLIINRVMPDASVTIQASESMTKSQALLDVIKARTTSTSVRFNSLQEFDAAAAAKYTHIVAEFVHMPTADIYALLNAYNLSTSTGVVCAVALQHTITDCARHFPNLVFATQHIAYHQGPNNFISRKHRTVFVCISHCQGKPTASLAAKPPSRVPKRGIVKRRRPSTDFIKPPSPLQQDFSFEHVSAIAADLSPRQFFEAITANSDSLQNESVAPIAEEQTLSAQDDEEETVPECTSSTEVAFTEAAQPEECPTTPNVTGIDHSTSAIVVQDDEETPISVSAPECTSSSTKNIQPEECTAASSVTEKDQSTRIIVVDDDECDDAQLQQRISDLKKRITAKTQVFRRYRSIMPVDSSPEFGGTCPTMTDRCIEIITELMCAWMNNNDGPHCFLDIRSKSTMGLLLSSIFRDVSFGHVVYSRAYELAIHDSHRMFNWPLKKVPVRLDSIRPEHLMGYNMLFASASCMGNKDHRQLECILDAFYYADDTEVLWMQMTRPQAAYAIKTFVNLKFNLVRSKFPNQSNDPLYEIVK